jgi:hypothetical protein
VKNQDAQTIHRALFASTTPLVILSPPFVVPTLVIFFQSLALQRITQMVFSKR